MTSAETPHPTRIRLTAKQIDMAEWALDAMASYLADDDGAAVDYTEDDLPTIDGDAICFQNDRAVADMLYRFEKQIPDMARDWPETRGAVIVARAVAVKIRDVMHYTGPPWMGPDKRAD